MRSFLSIVVATLWWSTTGLSQPDFEKIIGGKGDQFCFGVAVTANGYAVAGHTAPPGSLITDAWVLLLGADGDTVWTRTFGGPGIDDARSVAISPDSALVVCGTYSHSAPSKADFYLLKISPDGDTLWTRNRFSSLNAYGYSVNPATNGFILCGYADVGRSTPRMMLVRTDSNGDTLWTRLYGDTLSNAGFSAIQTIDGGFAACGYIDNHDPDWNRNIYVVRTNSNGDTLWTRSYSTFGYDLAWSIGNTAGNGFILTGYSNYSGSVGTNMYIVRLDGNGNVVWEKTFGQSGLDIGYSGIQTSDGGFVFCGESNVQGNELQSLYLVRTDASGDSVWTCLLGDYPANVGMCVRETPDSGFVIAGATTSASADGLYDGYVVRTDENGTITTVNPTAPDPPGIILVPNPSAGTFRIYAGVPIVFAEIIDISGRYVNFTELRDKQGTEWTVKLPSACNGLYIVRITTLQGTTVRRLIVY